jgi:hypothetical protein
MAVGFRPEIMEVRVSRPMEIREVRDMARSSVVIGVEGRERRMDFEWDMCVSRISENAVMRVGAEDQCGDWSLGFLVEGQRLGEWLLLTEPTALLIPFEADCVVDDWGCDMSSVESRDRFVPRGSLKLGFSSKFAVEELLIEETTVPLV